MFYISPWFPRAPIPLLPYSDGLCSRGLCVFLAVQIYLGSRGYTGREGGRGRRVCLCVCEQWKDTCSNSRFKGRLILNTCSTLIIIIYFCCKWFCRTLFNKRELTFHYCCLPKASAALWSCIKGLQHWKALKLEHLKHSRLIMLLNLTSHHQGIMVSYGNMVFNLH